MFPDIEHFIFIGLFLGVAAIILTTVITAGLRAARDGRSGRSAAICWQSEFAGLPLGERCCRHEMAGRVEHRICPRGFDCRNCPEYAQFAALAATATPYTYGLDFPADRFYHRGHTWVHPEEDGSLTVGLDDLAGHLIGEPDRVDLPVVGSELASDGTAWRMKKHGIEVCVRAPIDGEVIQTGGPSDGWYLKLKPHGEANLLHLLHGAEVPGWLSREMERLQLQLAEVGTAPSLADGGILVDDLMTALPQADWDSALAGTFLEA
jgi:glycine cleavage system H lipoate-binding protein